jgi:hypothetical protein
LPSLLLNETQVRPTEDDDADGDANQFCTHQYHQSERNPNYTVTLIENVFYPLFLFSVIQRLFDAVLDDGGVSVSKILQAQAVQCKNIADCTNVQKIFKNHKQLKTPKTL